MQFSILEKLGASLLICAWLIYGSHLAGNALIHVEHVTPAMATTTEDTPAKEEAAAPAEEMDLAALLADADPAAGKKAFSKCKACHTVDQGGKNKVGPNLWDIVGKAKAGVGGFKYSGSFTDLAREWTYGDLDAFLAKPKEFAPGTKMTFAGMKKAKDRAAVIAYLRSLSDSPKPLP